MAGARKFLKIFIKFQAGKLSVLIYT